MKVSNNALNFLLAQYRAIFKRAYVKGLASAVILTAGLAYGQSAAAAKDVTGAESWDAATSMTTTDINEDSTLKANTSAGEYAYFNGITIQSGDVTLENNKYLVMQGALTIGAEGKLTLSTSGSYGLLGHNKAADADVTTHDVDVDLINRGEFVVGKNNNANFNDVTLYSGSTVTISEAGGSAKTVANTANLFGGIGSGGNMDIQNGSTVVLNDYSQLGIEADNGTAAASKLTINGEIQMKTTVASGSAIIRAVDNGRKEDATAFDHSVIELGKDGKITVSGAGSMGIFAAEATLNGTIDVQNGTLRLDGDLTDTQSRRILIFSRKAVK